MGRTVSNVSLEPRLATVGFISVDGMQSHSATERIASTLLMIVA